MTTINVEKIERSGIQTRYRVVEIGPDGFLVLGEYADQFTAVLNAQRWQAESSN